MIIKNALVFQEDGSFVKKEIRIRGTLFEAAENPAVEPAGANAVRATGTHAGEPTETCAGKAAETYTGEVTGTSGEEAPGSDPSAQKAAKEEVVDAEGLMAIPGLVDIHFHGCKGKDFCDGTEEAIRTLARYEVFSGVTSMVPATMTFSEETLSGIMECAAAWQGKGAALRGINMEGPFISPEKKGAQNPAFIRRPDIDMFRRLQEKAKGLIRFCDIAPETEGAEDFIRELKDEVCISIAHTAADYDTAMRAFSLGARHVTHLYNAMPPFLHRAPGVPGAAFDSPSVTVELICDGIHLHPAQVRAAFRLFGDDRICLISDSMMATGLMDGEYSLGGQPVTVKGNRACLADGTIAGSATNLMDCLRTAVQKMGIPLGSAVKCAAVNPARAAGIFDICGSIAPGKSADLLLVDDDLRICSVICRGKKLF